MTGRTIDFGNGYTMTFEERDGQLVMVRWRNGAVISVCGAPLGKAASDMARFYWRLSERSAGCRYA